MKKKLLVLIGLCMAFSLFVACGVDYVDEYLALGEKYDGLVTEWDAYVDIAEIDVESLATLEEIDTLYNEIIINIDNYITQEEGMLEELESYIEGVDEESYNYLKEMIEGSLQTSKESRETLEENQMINKANLLYGQFNVLMEDWVGFCSIVETDLSNASADELNTLIDTTCASNDEYVATLETLLNDFNLIVGDDVDYAVLSQEISETIEIVKTMSTDLQALKE